MTYPDHARSHTSPRRIVKTEKSPDEATCGVDLDAPPEGMEALLERAREQLDVFLAERMAEEATRP